MMNLNKPQEIQGIFLLNKSTGMTSNVALQKAKRLFGAAKAGHTGSLDPIATGMLPLCFGEATKVCQYLLDADKCYEATGLFGIKTDSSDSTGQVIAEQHNFTILQEDLLAVLASFRGKTEQVPSMFSALKHQGLPLYHYARKGINIERAAREIHINHLELTAFDGQHFSFTVKCSKGTYIRNLIEDIGEAFGVGAHMTKLHRAHTAGFESYPMYTLDELSGMSQEERHAALIPLDQAITYLPKICLTELEVVALRQGRLIEQEPAMTAGSLMRLYGPDDSFIGIGEFNQERKIRVKRLMAY